MMYIIEMICDWIGAGKVYSKEKWTQHEPLNYYNKVRDERIIHPHTERLILHMLNGIDACGLEYFYYAAKRMKEDYETGWLTEDDTNEDK